MALLEVEGLTRRFAQGGATVAVLEDLTFALEAGRRLVLTGRSGSGKSTLLNLLAGLDAPDAGRVCWRMGGETFDLGVLGEAARTAFRRRHVGFVFQFFNLVPTLTALENVALLAEMNGLDAPLDRARDGLVALGLGHRLDAFPETLSGGEQQRVAIARALVHGPAAVLADEPTGNLDRGTGDAVFAELTERVAASGAALVLVTHDEELTRVADLRIDLGHGGRVA
ncbi:MAG: ABC transporter ATP-binding protein [Pseudomonadales bacterium]|jgi:putative ABC transport system ATP-binding protein|nr:ABC transporter ATP-binding protein [Pseudomonadales bacterium]